MAAYQLSEVESAAIGALDALGAMWRGDWSDFDGRTLRDQLDDIAGAISRGDVPALVGLKDDWLS